MKNTKQWFTLIELLVSIIIFTIIMVTSFAQFPYLMAVIKKVWNEKIILDESIKLKEELLFKNKSIAFYTYNSLYEQLETQYDLENKFRKNVRNIIWEVIENKYWIGSYKLNKPDTCLLPYDSSYYFSDLDKSILADEFKLNSCIENIKDSSFDDTYKILVVIDRNNLITNIYFSFRSKLHKISTMLITDLDNDDIIYNHLVSWKISLHIYDNFEINKFSWSSYNYCSMNNSLWEECIFTDYNKKQYNSWYLRMSMYKLARGNEEINIKSSYILDTLYSLNY